MSDNIISLVDKIKEDSVKLPYVIIDVDGREFYGEGFLIFTSQHVAIMEPRGDQAVPAIVVPLARVVVAELDDDDI